MVEAGNEDRGYLDRLTSLAMKHMERQSDHWEEVEQAASSVLGYLEELQEMYVDRVNAEKSRSQVIDHMDRVVGEIDVLVHAVAWRAAMDAPPRLPDGTDSTSEVVARFMELTHEHRLPWPQTAPVLYLAATAIERHYWAERERESADAPTDAL
jgi:hypothetical protein